MDSKEQRAISSGSGPSAIRALLSGVLGGLGIALTGIFASFLMPAGNWPLLNSFLAALLSGAVAAWVTAFRLGSSPWDATFLAFLTLLLLAFVSFLIEYAMLLNLAMAPYVDNTEAPEAAGGGLDVALVKLYLLVSLLNIPLGAVFGLLFGRPKTSPRT